ncbi:M56 family metallopeptidase [Persicitalea jodogahamensis]|uniref:Peptidase M56 domain-containing protein n=1 Tax=Persicitalea jodogahamensis TaxID=402147 RepID=A0A8J3G8T5_9BACT|nr:M56 family metallopeptidase [Persicitalea jodogahamensis]GHB68067.1 hypothetical protein GCM10007390_21730 [Persicitalea jodogahamensis]
MKILFDLSTSPYISTLGWTILHSLWQAALLGMVASLGFYLLRRRSAQSRYSLGVGVLGTQILASVATYFYYLPSSLEKTTATVLTNYQFVGSSANMSASGTAPLPLLVQIQLWLAVHLNELVICWLIGVSILLLRFAGGWFYLERLRFVSRPVKDRVWQTRFGVLVARLDIGRAVEFRETARIVTPMVVGVLRPVVLVPVGLLVGLSVAQVEAILAHELAHIRRHDYLVNLVQSFVEVVYFFHPALWWLSGRIRAEREHCCDDLAMAVCDDRLSLAHALVRVAEFRAEPALVVAFAANKRQLLSRVRRVLGVAEPASRRLAGYLPMAVVLISLSVGASVYAFQEEKLEDKQQQSGANVEKGREAVANTDTLIEREVEVLFDEKVDVETNLELAMQHEEPLFLVEGESVKVYGPNGEGPIHISGQGTVRTVNGNDTLQKKLAEYHAKMEALQKEMQPYQDQIQALQKQMEPLHQRIDDLSLQMQKEHFGVERFHREEEKLDWKKDQLMEVRQQLMEKRSAVMYPKNGQAKATDTEKQVAEFESQIKAKEQEITALNEQIKQNRVQSQEAGKPLDNLSAEMEKIGREAEVYNRKMEEISKKMEVISRKMEEEAQQIERLTSSTSRDRWGTTTIRGNGTTTTMTRSRSYPANPASPARPPKAPAPAPSAKSIPAAPAVAPVSKVLAAPTVPAAPPKKK